MAKPGSRTARQIAHGGKSSGARTIDTSGLERLAALMVEAQQDIAEAQAEHHLFPFAAAQKAVAAQMKAEEWCTRFPGEIAKFRGQLGMRPVPINGSSKQGRQAGYFQMPLRDGTTGYFQRGTDDCLQASIASCVQVKPHLVPVLHIDQQMMLDKDPEEIELGNNLKMGRWMDQHGVTICRHTALPSSAKRWIGVVPSNGITQHCLLMTGRDVLFDCASWTQPGKDEPVSSYSSSWTLALAPPWTLEVAPPAVGCCWC